MAATVEQAAFDDAAADFLAYESTVRGHVRYEVAQRNLRPFLPTVPAKVLDIQGGSGRDAVWLAGLGHRVTLLEESPKQRRHAEERCADLPPKVTNRIDIVSGTFSDIREQAGSFDVVLSHCVGQYQKDPHAFLEEAVCFSRQGGLFSVLEKGYFGTLERIEQEAESPQESHKLLELFRATQRTGNHLKFQVHAFKPRELSETLERNKLKILKWAGVRLTTDNDYRKIEYVSSAELRKLIKEEYRTGNDPEQRALGKLLHFIARK